MWQTLTQMYGGSFLTAYSVNDAPPTIWRSALGRLTRDEAKAGIAALAKQGRSYPPNLTEVLEACRPKKSVRYAGGPSSMYRPRALSAPLASEETRQRYLTNMRKLFRGVTRESVPHTERPIWSKPACTCKATGECDVCKGQS